MFNPSQVTLAVPPLVGTMGHAESEQAAALVVLTRKHMGDTWGPITPKDVGNAIKAELDAGNEPWKSLYRNPFFRPNFFELVQKGFARWIENEGGPLELTPKGLESISRWVSQPI